MINEGRLSRERATATAALLRVRIHEDEPFAHETAVVIENGPVQINVALQIAKQFNVVSLEYFVSGARLVFEGEVIGKAGTSSAFDSDSQAGSLNTFFLHHSPDFVDGVVADLDSHSYLLTLSCLTLSCFFFQSWIAALIASS